MIGLDDRSVAPAASAAPVASAADVANLAERPGCVTVYALILFFGASLLTLGGIALGGSGAIDGPQALLFLALGAAELAIAIGLWRMRWWAPRLLYIVQGIGIVMSLIFLLSGGGIGVLGGIAVNIYIISWFARNNRLFN